MTARQVLILAGSIFAALVLTIVAGFALQPVGLDRIGTGPWWDTLLRILVPLVWIFIFLLVSFWGVLALIAVVQGRRGAT